MRGGESQEIGQAVLLDGQGDDGGLHDVSRRCGDGHIRCSSRRRRRAARGAAARDQAGGSGKNDEDTQYSQARERAPSTQRQQ